MLKKLFYFLGIFGVIFFLFSAALVFAKADLSISETDITFSKENPLAGETIKIYARIFNTGDRDILGYVSFYDNGKAISEPQPISAKSNTYDDVFVDWEAWEGEHAVKAVISSSNPKDENAENDSAEKKDFFVDIDSDGDGISNTNDDDDDDDGLSDEEEQKIGTNPLLADSDGDGVNDKIDAFPKDSAETRDTDNDGLGDNKDLDDDGDGVFDDEETFKYGTNPLNADSDGDSLTDKEEIDRSTSPVKFDTDNDGKGDAEDEYPLDATKWQAGLLNSVNFNLDGKGYLVALGIPALFVLLFLFKGRRKRK